MQQKVVSREYKVMLKEERFVGLQADLLERAGEFWNAFQGSIQDIVLATEGNLKKIKKQRSIRFYDSKDHHLNKNSYVFRERVDLSTRKREVTLKFRHQDRYISQGRDMAVSDVENGEPKLEEDIKLPFIKLYSFSTKQPIKDGKILNKMKDPGKLYPDLQGRLKLYQKNEPIYIVGDFTAREFVVTGATFQIGKDPLVEAECALVAWYDEAGDEDRPIVVEFSFRYKNNDENFDGEAALRAYDVFGIFRGVLADWVASEGPTKTQYVYSKSRLL